MAHHGDIVEVTYNHATVGQGTMFPKAGEGNTYDLGGFENSDDDGSVAGNGDLIVTKNRKRGFFEIVVENDKQVRKDHEKSKQLQAAPSNADWTFQCADGAVFAGSGVIVGGVNANLNDGTFTLKVAFGKLKQIV